MKIYQNNNAVNFCASIVRPYKSAINSDLGFEPATKKDMINFYDRQIKELQRQKKEYLELDEFMHSDEIKKMIEKLPEEDSILMQRHCNKDNMLRLEYESQSDFINKEIMHFMKNPEYSDVFQFIPFNHNHELDKNGIKIWLSKLLHIVYR